MEGPLPADALTAPVSTGHIWITGMAAIAAIATSKLPLPTSGVRSLGCGQHRPDMPLSRGTAGQPSQGPV